MGLWYSLISEELSGFQEVPTGLSDLLVWGYLKGPLDITGQWHSDKARWGVGAWEISLSTPG